MSSKREKIRVTHISMTVGVGTGWPETWNAWALCRPDEVRVQKNFPKGRGMVVDVSDHGLVSKSSRVYKRAKMTSDKGGKIDWTDAGWGVGIDEGTPAIVYIPDNIVGLVNDD